MHAPSSSSAPSSSTRLRASFGAPTQPVSLKQLKNDLKGALKTSGLLDTVKAQIRREFIASLAESGKIGRVLQTFDGSHSGSGNSFGARSNPPSLKAKLALSACYHLLKKRGLVHSLSVFAAEAGLDSKQALLTEQDIVSSLNVTGSSPLYKAITTRLDSPGKENTLSTKAAPPPPPPAPSVLEMLFEHCFSIAQLDGRDSATQTDAPGDTATPREVLDQTIRGLRSSFLKSVEEERHNPVRATEERLLSYQRECDARASRDLEMQMAAFRDSQTSRIRLEETARAHLELQSLRNEMQAEHLRRSQQQQESMAEMARQAEERDRKVQLAAYEARQKMQRELDDMRNREQAAGRKLELDNQALRTLELRLKESQALVEARETAVRVRETEANRRFNNALELAKQEARGSLAGELDAVMKDRSEVVLDRRRLAEERAGMAAELEAVTTLRSINKDHQTRIAKLEEELSAALRKIASQDAIIHGADTESGRSQLLVYAKRNTELEARLIVLEGAEKELKRERQQRAVHEGASGARAAEIDRLKTLCADVQGKHDTERQAAESLRKELQAERLRCTAATLRAREMENLLGEKKRTIAALMKAGSVSATVEHQAFGATMTHRSQRKKAEDLATRLILSRQEAGAALGAGGQLGTLIAAQMYNPGPNPPPTPYPYPNQYMYPPPYYMPANPTPTPSDTSFTTAPTSTTTTTTTTAPNQTPTDSEKIDALRADLERQRINTELDALRWEKTKIDRQRALYQREEELERERLEAEAIRLGAERLELQRRKQVFVAHQELQQTSSLYPATEEDTRGSDELLDRPLPAAEAVRVEGGGGAAVASVVTVATTAATTTIAVPTATATTATVTIAAVTSTTSATSTPTATTTIPKSSPTPIPTTAPNPASSTPNPASSLQEELVRAAIAEERERVRIREELERKERADREVEAARERDRERREKEEERKELLRLREKEAKERDDEAKALERLAQAAAAKEKQLKADEAARKADAEALAAAADATRRAKEEREQAERANKTKEQRDKIDADRRAVEEARQRVLARRAMKKEREGPSVTAGDGIGASKVAVPSPTRAAPRAPEQTKADASAVDVSCQRCLLLLVFLLQFDLILKYPEPRFLHLSPQSDVEITGGGRSDDEQDGGWF